MPFNDRISKRWTDMKPGDHQTGTAERKQRYLRRSTVFDSSAIARHELRHRLSDPLGRPMAFG